MTSDPIPYPPSDGPIRIAAEICTILTRLPFVRRIALFGSLAEDRSDRWSDIDMLVACSQVGVNAWGAASAIRSIKPVLFYREFSAAAKPAGRYWFDGESLFHKLDISFHSVAEYESHLHGSDRYGHPVTLKEIYASASADSTPAAAQNDGLAETTTAYETELGSHIYSSLRALKRRLRNQPLNGRDVRGIAGLRNDLVTLPRSAVMTGGRVGELVHRVGEMLEQSGLEI